MSSRDNTLAPNNSTNNNTITVKNTSSTVYYVFGGYSDNTNVYENTVNISGGTINGTIRGGATDLGLAINNTINISGNPIFGAGAGLFGGEAEENPTFEYSIKGNTLNLKTKDITVQHVGNFEFVNFYLPNNIKANDTILTSDFVRRLNQSKIGIGVMNGNTLAIKTGDKVTLINATPL
ncbi:hypothetical protein [Campylobacter iguaniorum]|uniref:hypothetical protein n=1 Tax=Campylobacter iguaniorum TaxID=1244531 RepID=UPI0007C95B6D|nr:hypothetical protein [Campylobacter iguaniorum]